MVDKDATVTNMDKKVEQELIDWLLGKDEPPDEDPWVDRKDHYDR